MILLNENDKKYMNIAIDLAEATGTDTSPNPKVGCVIVNEGQIVGIGSHLKAGEPHAEVHALNMAGNKAKGATVYVTLEPCNHVGKTPPCTQALIAAKVKRVVIADAKDPNPLVSGTGVNKLMDAGIQVTTGVLEKKAKSINEYYNHYIKYKVPFVTLKTAITLDGKIATATNDSKWITGSESREDVHHIRSKHDGILTGINTILHDDPQLNVRLTDFDGKQPAIIILDSNFKIPLSSKVLSNPQNRVIIFTNKKSALNHQFESNIEVIYVEKKQGQLNIEKILSILAEKYITSLLVEAGGQINSSFLNGGFVNTLICFIAPKLIGGKESKSFYSESKIAAMNEALKLQLIDTRLIGQDIKLTYKL